MKKFKFTVRGNDYDVHIQDFDNNVIELEVNGSQYSVELHEEVKKTKTPKLVRQKVQNPAGAHQINAKASSGTLKINSPLPGTILSIAVKEGDAVKKSDVLLVMEAMKMENNVLAEKDGVIKSIKTSVGATVLQNDLLIEIE